MSMRHSTRFAAAFALLVASLGAGQRDDAALAGEKRLPGRLRADAERRNETYARDDDASPFTQG